MYFISRNNTKEGPYTLGEALQLNLTDDVLVWKEGMTDWASLSSLPEFTQHIIKTPPPLPTDIQKIKERQALEQKRSQATKIILHNALIGLVVAVVLDFIAGAAGSDGGSNAFPVYLTQEERNNPVALYLDFIPACLFIAEVIMLGLSAYQISTLKPSKILINENDN